MKRATKCTTKRTTARRIVAGAALALALVPGSALAAGDSYGTAAPAGLEAMEGGGSSSADFGAGSSADGVASAESAAGDIAVTAGSAETDASTDDPANVSDRVATPALLASVESQVATQREVAAANAPARRAVARVRGAVAEQTDKVLAYDPADIAAIGTQAATGHTICCPSFSCAYADAVLDGTVHDHSYYVCCSCRWTDWGGGNSSFRVVGSGSDADVLREAYDQIAVGRPTVVHVSAGYGEHWIALIGYAGAADPDNLTLANFIALDPWDGAQIVASDRFRLYGDGCQHISDR